MGGVSSQIGEALRKKLSVVTKLEQNTWRRLARCIPVGYLRQNNYGFHSWVNLGAVFVGAELREKADFVTKTRATTVGLHLAAAP